MNKIIVIYQSKYGTTKKYAQWISEELSCDLLERKMVKVDNLKEYDTIIYGGWLYAGRISGINLMLKSYESIKDKKLIAFTCSVADPNDLETTNNIKENLSKAMTSEMQQNISVYHLRGGIDYTKLNIIHKIMMAILYKIISIKNYSTLREEEKQVLETYGKTVDFTDKSTIEPILSFARGL